MIRYVVKATWVGTMLRSSLTIARYIQVSTFSLILLNRHHLYRF
jgi:hypothetical protein